MAILTPAQLQSSNASTYTTNGTNSITGAAARSFNVDFISSSITVSQTGSMSVLSASFAPSTPTFPFTGSAIISGSLTITGSAYGNVVGVTVSSNTASIDLLAGNFFTVTLANSATTFFNFTNVKPGLTANLILTTGTVSTASFSSNVKQPSGSSYLPTSGSGRVDALSVAAVDASNLYLVASKFFI
jgi:hypothetical protein